MNLFNRAFVVAFCIFFILFWAIVIVAFIAFPSQTASTISAAASFLRDNMTLYLRIMISLLAAAFILVALLLLLYELTPPKTADIPLPHVAGGEATLAADAIIQRIKHEAEALPQVRETKPTVVARGKAVDVHLDVLADPDIEVAPATEEIIRVVRENVKNKIGIDLRRVTVRVRHEPIPREKVAAVRRAAPAAEGSSRSTEAAASAEEKPRIIVPDAVSTKEEPSEHTET